MNREMRRVLSEAEGWNVTVNGWQDGTKAVPGFATVTDRITLTTFAVKHGETLAGALVKAQARMAAGRRK